MRSVMLTRIVIVLLLLRIPIPDLVMKHMIAKALGSGGRPRAGR